MFDVGGHQASLTNTLLLTGLEKDPVIYAISIMRIISKVGELNKTKATKYKKRIIVETVEEI